LSKKKEIRIGTPFFPDHWPVNRPNSVIRVRREKVMVHSGSQTRPGTGSLHPVAIRAAVEATRPLKPLVQKVVKATR